MGIYSFVNFQDELLKFYFFDLYSKVNNNTIEDFEQPIPQQQGKTLRDFKEVLQNLVYLLRTSTKADTACLYWVNRSRRQFVKEAQSTIVENAQFEDRVSFEDHFLNEFKNISNITELKPEATENFTLLLIPFVSKAETVALTVLEWRSGGQNKNADIIKAYSTTLGKMLNTYLEITNLYDTEQEWTGYEHQLDFLDRPGHYTALLSLMLQELQLYLPNGSVSIIANGVSGWATVLHSKQAVNMLPIGLPVEKNSVAANAIENDASEFTIHFNESPKRVSLRETGTEGATLAVPLIMDKQLAAIILLTDENPLIFKESTKHKLKNIIRLTALEMQTRLNKSGEGLRLTDNYGAVIPDIWERTVDTEILRLNEGRSEYTTWAGFATLSELPKLRTQLRVEELRHMQKDIIRVLVPSQYGISGFVGFHADHQYFVLLQSKNSNVYALWKQAVDEMFSKPFVLSIGKQIKSRMLTGFIKLDSTFDDSYEVVQRCKQELNDTSIV